VAITDVRAVSSLPIARASPQIQMTTIPIMQLTILIPAVVLAAALDWKSRRIPNPLTVIVAVSGLVFLAVESSASAAVAGLGQGTLVGLACMPLYLLRGMSAGDVKLISATSIWWTSTQLLTALVATALAGAILATIYVCAVRGTTHVPYAIAIAASTVGTTFSA
jgi:prepilin peptidase CpaA